MLDRRPLVVHPHERVLHELLGDGLVADDQRREAHHRLVAVGEQIVEGHRRACAHGCTPVLSTGSVFTSSATILSLRHPSARRGSQKRGS